MRFSEIVQARQSVKNFDPAAEMTDAELKDLFRDVVLTPSSFNLQHWHFVAVRETAVKKRLMEAAHDQPHVGDASLVVVVCGNLKAHERIEEIYAEAPEEARRKISDLVRSLYSDPQKAREEAVRSGSLAAMTLMLKAQDMGYATCPMIGFDPGRVTQIVQAPAEMFPVMMVTVGKATGAAARPRPYRLPMRRVVTFNTVNGEPLED